MCELCQKKCKSKSGLKRHKTAKHKEEHRHDEIEQQRHDFTVQDFISLSMKAQAKILENKVYPQSTRDELMSYPLPKLLIWDIHGPSMGMVWDNL